MKRVGSALGGDVDHSARGAAIFGLETAALYLYFADELERDRALASEGPVADIRDVHTIDHKNILGTAGAIDGIAADAAGRIVSCSFRGATSGTPGPRIKDHAWSKR